MSARALAELLFRAVFVADAGGGGLCVAYAVLSGSIGAMAKPWLRFSAQYAWSTAAHEFGHQIGTQHGTSILCLCTVPQCVSPCAALVGLVIVVPLLGCVLSARDPLQRGSHFLVSSDI